MRSTTVGAALALVLLLAGCADPAAVPPAADGTGASATTSTERAADPSGPTGARMVVRVTGERPHDPTAFTQGLEFGEDGRLFESRGLYGESAVTEVDPDTGAVLARTDLEDSFFAEGLTAVGDQLLQITWQEHTAIAYDADTLEQTGTFTYDGEGWGLCDADGALFMSNGTSTLTRRDLATFEATDTVTVTLDGQPVERLNELECAAGLVWANVWQTNTIVVIEPGTGEVIATVDASPIARSDGRWSEAPTEADVLNGIAWDPGARVWLLTGKLWPVTYEVALDCVEDCVTAASLPLPYQPRRPAG